MITKPYAVFGDPVLEDAEEQLKTCLEEEHAVAGALMADHHKGYSMPIGGVIAYDGAISPSGVGYDIACGNKAVQLDIGATDLGDVKSLMREIQRNVKFGVGGRYQTASDHQLFDDPLWDEIEQMLPGLKNKAREQLGTVGAGNHYVDVLVDEGGLIWIANHFGSRGFGHTIATAAMNLAEGLPITKPRNEERHVVIGTDWDLGQFYIQAMNLAGWYAYAGRDFVIDQVLSLLGNPEPLIEVHNHHNFAWEENGTWVVRKGATPLIPDHFAYIGGSMGEGAAIVRGTGQDLGDLASAPHGAGRVMSRTQAAGKMRKMWVCNSRDCRPRRAIGLAMPEPCPTCGATKFRKVRMRDPETAQINWQEERQKLEAAGVVVLGGDADESPGVYKSLDDVLGCHTNIEIVRWLYPLGVIMAGPDVHDPYKD